MSLEEYNNLKGGDRVWYFNISFNPGSLHGTIKCGLIAELEKREGEDRFNVTQVKKGSSVKAGGIISFSRINQLFKDYNEGVDYWNAVVQNEVDRLTFNYEISIKRVKGRLIDRIWI